jgi:hypothetical protein
MTKKYSKTLDSARVSRYLFAYATNAQAIIA